MCAAHQHEIIVDLIFVVTKIDRTEGIRVEAQISRETEAREARKIRALLGESVDPRKNRVIRTQSLRGIKESCAHVVQSKLVDGRRSEHVHLGEPGALLT